MSGSKWKRLHRRILWAVVASGLLAVVFQSWWNDYFTDPPLSELPWILFTPDRGEEEQEDDDPPPPPSPAPLAFEDLLGLPIQAHQVIEALASFGRHCKHRRVGGLHRCVFPLAGVDIAYERGGMVRSIFLAGPFHRELRAFAEGERLPHRLPGLHLLREEVRLHLDGWRQRISRSDTDCYSMPSREVCVTYRENGRPGPAGDGIVHLFYALGPEHPDLPLGELDDAAWIDLDSAPELDIRSLPID